MSKFFNCLYPGCTRRLARPYELDRHTKIHLPARKFDCPQGTASGSFCKRVGERGFTRRDKLNDHVRRVHCVSVPRSPRAMRDSINYNQPATGEIEQHSKKDATTHPALATGVELQQYSQRPTELQRPVDDHSRGPNARGGQVPDRVLASDEAIAVSYSGSSNLEDDILLDNEVGSNVKQLPSVSDMATTMAFGDSGDMTGVGSQFIPNKRIITDADFRDIKCGSGGLRYDDKPSLACEFSDTCQAVQYSDTAQYSPRR